MEVVLEGQILGGRKGHARCQEPLHGRIVGLVEEQHRARQGAGPFELLGEEGHLSLGDAHGGKDHREFAVLADDPRLPGDLGRQFVGGKAGTREDGELLATNQGQQRIDGRDAGLNELLGLLTGHRVDRGAADGKALLCDHRRQAIDGLADAVETPTDHLPGDAEAGHTLHQTDGGGGKIDARRFLEHLKDGDLVGYLDHLTAALAAGTVLDAHDRVVGEIGRVLEEEQRSRNVTDVAIFFLQQFAHISPCQTAAGVNASSKSPMTSCL